ncbi:hypothetical protein ACFFX0_02190 [Citricoccus parietis]|uniref:Uncharacterized protein n=1 Tax=Citricoccus parietis TaxID=592307 RepID=A0ABV5FUW6_9MICC
MWACFAAHTDCLVGSTSLRSADGPCGIIHPGRRRGDVAQW